MRQDYVKRLQRQTGKNTGFDRNVGFLEISVFVPVSQVRNLEELNTRLGQQCLEHRQRRLRGKTETKLSGFSFCSFLSGL